jgi:ribosome maturation factor RimP
MRQNLQKIKQALTAAVETMGYDLFGIELYSSRGNATLRVYIDDKHGITLADCQRVSHQLSGLLNVDNLISGRYTLEISSPGLERPLLEHQHFVRFSGSKVRIQLRELLNGRRRLIGHLLGVKQNDILFADGEGREWRIPFERIAKARLVSEL